jgi:NADPH-dependent curcumin reductase CurA
LAKKQFQKIQEKNRMSDQLIPPYNLPDSNRQVILRHRATGIPQAEDFSIEQGHVPAPGDGEMLVRAIYLSVDPAQRGWIVDTNNYSAPVAIGSVMRALAVGVVIRSNHQDFAEGDFLYGWLGWQDYAVIGPEQVLSHIGQPKIALSAYAGVLGLNGLTAYLALSKLGRPKDGETVLVSTSAGAVGSVVGQLAKHWGCRTLGITGSDDKVKQCIDSFGYDAAINYKTAPVAEQLANITEGGVDVYFDNVGGPILDASLRTLNINARVVQCGTASIATWVPLPTGPRNEREILTRRLVWSGFVIFDHADEIPAAREALEKLVKDGHINYLEDIDAGIEHAPGAIASLYAGDNSGKKLIYIGE